MPRVNVTLTAEELAYVDRTRGRHSRSSRVAEIVAADAKDAWWGRPDKAPDLSAITMPPYVPPVTSTRRDGTDVIDTGGERYAVAFADGDVVIDGVRLPSRSGP